MTSHVTDRPGFFMEPIRVIIALKISFVVLFFIISYIFVHFSYKIIKQLYSEYFIKSLSNIAYIF